jgi:transposase-like protein
MVCATCKCECQRFGTIRNGSQRFRCVDCKKTYSAAATARLLDSTIPLAEIETVLQLLLEGCSFQVAERISRLNRDTILKLLVTASDNCKRLMSSLIVHVPVKDLECNEVFGFLQKKQERVLPEDDQDFCDAYCIRDEYL